VVRQSGVFARYKNRHPDRSIREDLVGTLWIGGNGALPLSTGKPKAHVLRHQPGNAASLSDNNVVTY
jgi:hypothetical protein